MALSFLYLAFTRILQLLRLSRRDSDELAVEVVMLRHEVAVLRRQVVRPCGCRECHPGTLSRTFVEWPGTTKLGRGPLVPLDRKSTRLNSSHLGISYAVFCLKKKKI